VNINSLTRKWKSFQQLPRNTRLVLPLVWLLLGTARFTIFALPFSWVRYWLGGEQQTAPWLLRLPASIETQARTIGQQVRTAARFTPWESNCFTQALVARTLLILQRIPHTVFFGLRREHGQLKAHSWVMCGRVAVTGGQVFGYYTVVGCFEWPDKPEGP